MTDGPVTDGPVTDGAGELCGGPVNNGAVDDKRERRAIIVELAIVGILTFGFSAIRAGLVLLEYQLGSGVGNAQVAINPALSPNVAISGVRQVLHAVELCAMGALGVYLLWRGGVRLGSVGLSRPRARDLVPGAGLAALIGIPGLALVAASAALGINADLIAANSEAPWWELVLLCLIAVGNAIAEEVLVVAYFMTRLRRLGMSEAGVLASSALLRGAYHLYQGFGAGLGNLVMGLVFGRWYQKTSRVWPLVVAHALIDMVAFVGYALLSDHLGFLGL